jgi:AcrR family transcriptional regulator
MTKARSGKYLGRKGQNTRRKIIDETVSLLETVSLRELRVAEVARVAGTSPAAFYVYFSDVSEVVLAAINELSQSTPEILAVLAKEWDSSNGEELATAMVRMHFTYWNAHKTLFRIRNLAAEEGDQRFIDSRTASVQPLVDAISNKIQVAQRSGSITATLHPVATSGVIVAMLERVAAIMPHNVENRQFSPTDMAVSTSFILAMMLKTAH